MDKIAQSIPILAFFVATGVLVAFPTSPGACIVFLGTLLILVLPSLLSDDEVLDESAVLQDVCKEVLALRKDMVAVKQDVESIKAANGIKALSR